MTPDPQTEIARLQYAICEQATEINRLRDEIDRLLSWINGDVDALTTLQGVYLDPKESAGNKIKAAASAIGYERPRMTPTNLVVLDFRERVRQARLKAPLVEPKVIEHIP
jgi:hypothetical protein